MLGSKYCISHVLSKVPISVARQDCTVIARNFSLTSVLERRINTRKPRPPCHERALLNEICKVKFAPNLHHLLPSHQRCQKALSRQWLLERKGLDEENVYENILAKEILDLFQKSKMIAIVHKHSMLAEVSFEVRHGFKKLGMQMRDYYGRHTIEMALTNTRYMSIMPLFRISEALVFSPEEKVDALLKLLKKTPQVTLMALIVDGRLLSKTEAEFFASTDLASQQAQLVQTIGSVASTLTSQLNHHASTLVGCLDQHASSEQNASSEQSAATEENASTEQSAATEQNASSEQSTATAQSPEEKS